MDNVLPWLLLCSRPVPIGLTGPGRIRARARRDHWVIKEWVLRADARTMSRTAVGHQFGCDATERWAVCTWE